MPSHSEGPGIWLSVLRFLLTHCLYERAAEVLARLRRCAGAREGSGQGSDFAARISDKYQIRLTRPIYKQNGKQNDLCTQKRLRPAWASAKSDQSSLSTLRFGSLATHKVHSKDPIDCAYGPADLSLLGAQVILLVLSCTGSLYS